MDTDTLAFMQVPAIMDIGQNNYTLHAMETAYQAAVTAHSIAS